MHQKQHGFTLIELLVAATIIIVLATLGLVSYRVAARNSRNAKRKSDLETVRQAMMMYRSEEGAYLAADNFEHLVDQLIEDGYLIEGEFKDPNHPQQKYEYVDDPGSLQLRTYLEPDNDKYNLSLPN